MKVLHEEEYQKHKIQILLLGKTKKLIIIEKNGWKIYDKRSKDTLWDCIGQALTFIDDKKGHNHV